MGIMCRISVYIYINNYYKPIIYIYICRILIYIYVYVEYIYTHKNINEYQE